MKRLYLLIAAALLLLGVASSAGVWDIPSGTANAGVIISGTPDEGPGVSYNLAWTGEDGGSGSYFSDGDADGNTMTDIGSTYADTGDYGARLAAPNDWIMRSDYPCPTAGTVWLRVNMRQPTATRGNEASFFEWSESGANYIGLRIDDSDDNLIIWTEIGNTQVKFDTTEAFTEDTWVTVGVSWDLANDDIIAVVGSTSWGDGEENTSFGWPATSWTTPVTDFVVGERAAGSNITTNEEVWIDNVYYTSGYKAACPIP